MPHSFAGIPHEIRRRVTGGERVALVLLDGLGLPLLHRHDDHPLVRRLVIRPLRTQFPSTTTAHVTTIHFGLPVGLHGLYEWNILEPSLNELICPLRFNRAGSDIAQQLEGPSTPPPWLRARRSTRRSGPTVSSCILDRSRTRPTRGWRPGAPRWTASRSWPRGPGSSRRRDVFLHVHEGHVEEVIHELRTRLGDRARVAPAASLFRQIGDRLRARLGQMVVLPAAGRQTWLGSASANERWWRGQHGGLEPAETETYVAQVHDPGRIG